MKSRFTSTYIVHVEGQYAGVDDDDRSLHQEHRSVDAGHCRQCAAAGNDIGWGEQRLAKQFTTLKYIFGR